MIGLSLRKEKKIGFSHDLGVIIKWTVCGVAHDNTTLANTCQRRCTQGEHTVEYTGENVPYRRDSANSSMDLLVRDGGTSIMFSLFFSIMSD